MDSPILGQLTNAQFISQYWQKKPLLIRQAIKDFQTDLSAEILAGLALEDNVRSRIVIEHAQEPKWECQFGPFVEENFSQLPDSNWTLLVQDVEKHLPEYAGILDNFAFLPRWRVDDLMVSYAVDGGSVGPHTDNYDVFLLQAQGQRQWQIQADNIQPEALLDDIDLRILRDFQAEQQWTLNPGDILYLPPGVAHHGIAIGDCMTFSIGFRAPSQVELLQLYADQISTITNNTEHYKDPPGLPLTNRGELDAASLGQFRRLLQESVNNDEAMTQAIARQLTDPVETPALFDTEVHSLEAFTSQLGSATVISFHPAVRSLYIRDENGLRWFVNSLDYQASGEAAEAIMHLVDNYRLESEQIEVLLQHPHITQALFQLYQDGGLNIAL